MSDHRMNRNLWIVASISFTIGFVLDIKNNSPFMMPTLKLITTLLCLFNAYNSHKKLTSYSTKKSKSK